MKHPCLFRRSFATLRHLRFLVIDEADKLLDHLFNQWLPKILSAVETDKYGLKGHSAMGGRQQQSVIGLRDTLIGLCSFPKNLQLMVENDRYSKVLL